LESVYGVDKNAAYLFGRRVVTADPASFRVVDPMHGLYSADKVHAYYEGRVLPSADGATFRRVRDDWFRDAKRLYWLGHEVVGAEPESFQFFLTPPWERDRNDVYRGYTPVHAEDPALFVPINYDWGRDAKAYYSASLPKLHPQFKVDCDYASMVVLDDTYAKDKDRGYFFSYPLPGSDGPTFHVIGYDLAEDKTGAYNGYQRIKASPSEIAEQVRLDAVAKQVLERRAQRAADKAEGKP
jgi:hypothetical protein